MSIQNDEPEDFSLIGKLKDGHDREVNDALIGLVNRHGEAVMHYLIGYFRMTPPEAEDIFQEALARAFYRISTYDPARGTFRSWLIAIALNVKRQELREKRARQKLANIDDPQVLDEVVPVPDDTADRATAEDLRNLVLEYMKDRSPLDQAIVRALMHYEDKPMADERIAQAFSTSVEYVQKRRSHLRTKLREVLVERKYPLMRNQGEGR